MNWFSEIEKRKEDLIKDTQDFLKIKSVLDETDKAEGAPFGKGIKEALDYALEKCSSIGLTVKNLDGYAGHAELGTGDEIVGILCHVDVVPEGDGWTSPPYSAEIRDGKIYARGAIDDKGPTMAAIYALKVIKELNLKLNKRVRIIFGTDEESGWRGIHKYFEQEEMPVMGFAPDADFPIIISEKGIANLTIDGRFSQSTDNEKARIVSFVSGKRTNMVPDLAEANIEGTNEMLEKVKDQFVEFLKVYEYGGEYQLENNKLNLKLKGISAHGMEPYKGVNAGLEMIHFFITTEEVLQAEEWMKFLDKYLYQDFYGKALGVEYEDDQSGMLTINTGVMQYNSNQATIKLNIRYPLTAPFDDFVNTIKDKLMESKLELGDISNTKPHHVDKDHFLVKTLKKVYEEQTGQEATLLSIGGGTYSRALKTGVAFGPLFPGKKETAHQKDEYLEIEDLLKASSIYAQAIYELAK